ncbi:uncharacterized protein [Cardiocondyla obscurior]|uniref:uncharacterized protein isoform X2 n=1 Tax=Cardiocondyla obscurior TaxID=286306 RepID=UPI0039657A39
MMDIKRLRSRSQLIGPKVYKNKRLDEKWGTEYHTAIQEIVFGRQCPPYVPAEPPMSMTEDNIESGPLYECKQCKDGFRFQSSFEEHNKRHSWILGLWCHRCFDTICTHQNKDKPTAKCYKCYKCLQEVTEKRAYLRAKSEHGRQKKGAVKVFYNQCQFIEHMKMHRLSSVNMADLILMPLPVGMSDSDWSSDFEILCEALMERAFLSRKHIIDWLKTHELEDNWWKLVNGKSNINLISEIVENYGGRQLFKTTLKKDIKSNSSVIHRSNNNSPNIEFIDNSLINQDTNSSTDTASDKGIEENEDNPCTSTDITFVDCGPTSLHLQPEISESYTHKEQETIQKTITCHATSTAGIINLNKNAFKDHHKIETNDNRSNKNLIIESSLNDMQQNKVQCVVNKTVENNSSITNITKWPSKSNFVKTVSPFSANHNRITKIDVHNFEKNYSTSKANNNSKVLTVHDSKNIAAIISQLPPDLLTNTKVLVIPQKLCNIISRNESEVNIKKDSSISTVDNDGIDSNTLTQKTSDSNVKKEETTKKVMIKDGKKYIIKCKNTNETSSSNLSIVKNPIKAVKQSPFESSILKTMILASNLKESKNTCVNQASLFNKNVSIAPLPSLPSLPSTSSLSIPPLVTSSKLSNNSVQSNDESHAKETQDVPKLQKAPPHLISIYPVQNYIFESISLINNDKGDLCMDVKIIERIARESFRDVCDVIVKYKREMFNEFYQMNSLELKERMAHLRNVSSEIKQVLNFIPSNVFKEKLRAVRVLQCILDECFKKYKNVQEEEKIQDKDILIYEWETRTDMTLKCFLCRKLMKSKSYIPGFSKLPKIDGYCSCYKNVCHECRSCQEHIAQFIAHQNYHKQSKPHVCPDCNYKFNDAVSLEVHLWTVCFHTLKKLIYTCKVCDIDGFKDLESVTRHFVIMHSKKKIGCEDCLRVLPSYNEYIQHCTEMHSSKTEYNPTRIVICKLSNVALRWENYMTYLEKYPAIRKVIWFKCPFCHLTTTDNKHVKTLLNDHMRSKHMEQMSDILSVEAFIKIFGQKLAEKNEMGNVSYSNLSCTTVDDVVPKIVSTRTISSETFEHGSQDVDSMWSTNTNIVNEENPQTMKKIDGKEKQDLLPKILNVTSINDLKLSTYISKETIPQLIETKTKSNFPSFQFVVDNEAKNVNLSVSKEASMENNDKSNTNEETTETKKPDEDNNESTMNAVYISNLEKPLLDTIRVNLPITSDKIDSNSTSEESTNSRIKIVDFRKICKPDVEQFVITKMFNLQMKDENAGMGDPPPLVKFPNYLLEPIEINELENKPVINLEKSKVLIQQISDESKMRICVGTDTHEEGIDYLCHLCEEPINSSSFVARKHFREKHSDEYKVTILTPQLSQMSSDFINNGYKLFINNKKRKSDGTLLAAKRKRRWTPKKHIEMKDASPPTGLCVKQETAEDDEGNFVCKKCGQRCTDMSDLREHIADNHRLKGRYMICLECGENFVVAPSLQMHLKAFHGIDDPINYMNQNPSYAPNDSDLQTEGKPTVANQCYVCMAVFEDKAAVDKHLRVHGMAFLNHKRIEAKNALEKKINTEENKPSIKQEVKETEKLDKPAETILEKINAAI